MRPRFPYAAAVEDPLSGVVAAQQMPLLTSLMADLVEAISPPGTEENKARFVTFSFSHCCEKARWALDLSPMKERYTEDCHPPGLHILIAGRLSNLGKRTVPLLVASPDKRLQDSTDIIKYLVKTYPEEAGYLLPKDKQEQALSMIADFDSGLGPATRLWAYSQLLDDLETMKGIFTMNVPGIEAQVGRMIAARSVGRIRQGYGVNPESAAEAKATIWKEFDKVDAQLSDGRRYLLGGERLSAVDITFAAYAYPAVAPPELRNVVLPYDSYPAEMKEEVERLRATKAGQFALRLYREERYEGAPPGTPVVIRNDKRKAS